MFNPSCVYIPSTSVKVTEFKVESDGKDANLCASFVSSPLGLRASAIRSLSLTSAKDSDSDLKQSAAYAFKQRRRNPIGNNGSVRQSNREGDSTKSTSTGVYAINIPSGFLIFNCIHFKVTPKFRLAPAESPIKI